MERVAKAIEFATKCHAEQFDKAGEPYILHPIRVMLEFKDPIKRCAAVMHDTVEDCGVSLDEIERFFGKDVRRTVDAVTRREGEKYMDFIRRCVLDKDGRQIKLMDIKDNTRPERYNPTLTGLQGRYIKAQAIIVDAMKEGDSEDVQFLYDKALIPYYEYMALMQNVEK